MKNVKAFFSVFAFVLITVLIIGCNSNTTASGDGNGGGGGGGTTLAKGPAAVDLGIAGNFVILAKSAITTGVPSVITGDLGLSPADRTYLHGFSEVMDATNVFSTSTPQVTGKLYAADYAVPTPDNMTATILKMENAYTDAAGRTTPDFLDLGAAGDISGLTLVPGLYKWTMSVFMNSDITLSGGPNDVWIFQISGDLTLNPGSKMILAGGAQPKNIFWQTTTAATLGTTAHLEGIVLSKTAITTNNGASVNGRLFAQTAVTVNQSTITQPAP
jgi:hypothetical protein